MLAAKIQSYKDHETGSKNQDMGAGLACKKRSN
jgi:hypothetical protein